MSEWSPVWAIIVLGNLAAFLFVVRYGRKTVTPVQRRLLWVVTGVSTVIFVAGIYFTVSPIKTPPPAVPLVAVPAHVAQPQPASAPL